MLSFRALSALAALLVSLPAAAAQSPAAVFGIELAEPGTIGPRPVKPEDARRLGLASEALRREVAG
ncbi:hypothetical protein CS379_19650, partial [Methylobacterium frigidaeris]